MPDSLVPLGTETPRSKLPTFLWGLVFAAWFVFLLWMAWLRLKAQ